MLIMTTVQKDTGIVGKTVFDNYCEEKGDPDIKKLLQPINYIARAPEKQLFPKLIKAFNLWLNIPEDKQRIIEDIVETIHFYGLVLDDVQDNSDLRRGLPAAHSVFGVAPTINSANYALIVALEKVLTLGHPKAIAVWAQQLMGIYLGQGKEINERDNYLCPTIQEYEQTATEKTGSMFALVFRLMQLFSENQTDFSKLLNMFGLYYQIQNDYCDLGNEEYIEDKSFGDDITEGKFSFPIIHALQTHPDDGQIMNILRQRTRDVKVKKQCVALLEEFGSVAYTRQTMKDLDQQIRSEVERLGGNPGIIALMDRLIVWKE